MAACEVAPDRGARREQGSFAPLCHARIPKGNSGGCHSCDEIPRSLQCAFALWLCPQLHARVPTEVLGVCGVLSPGVTHPQPHGEGRVRHLLLQIVCLAEVRAARQPQVLRADGSGMFPAALRCAAPMKFPINWL